MVIRIIAIKAVLDSNFYNCFLIRMWKDLDQDPYDFRVYSFYHYEKGNTYFHA